VRATSTVASPRRAALCLCVSPAADPWAPTLPARPAADARSDVLTDVEFDAFEVWVGKAWAEKGDPPTAEEVRDSAATSPLAMKTGVYARPSLVGSRPGFACACVLHAMAGKGVRLGAECDRSQSPD
jgi:hypothetical protein